MKIFFFWGKRWSQRGIAFQHGHLTRNVHYIDLVCCRGYTTKTKIRNFKYAWKKLLTLGY